MALNTTKLKSDVKAAFQRALQETNPNNRARSIEQLADDISKAVETFVKSGQVNPGIPVATTGTASAQTGQTTGIGTIS